MATNYKIIAMRKPAINEDGTRFSLPFFTDKGEITLDIDASLVDSLMTILGDAELRGSKSS